MLIAKHVKIISEALNIRQSQVENTAKLLEEGATVPFISRYRKEVTGSLDEVQIAGVQTELKKLQELEKRRETILKAIEEQGKLTESLKLRINATYNPTELEDLYLPYKKKRKTRATVAKEKGLEPLALVLKMQAHNTDPEIEAGKYLSDEVESPEDALQGARDIIAEWINEDEETRNVTRKFFERKAMIRSKVARGKDEEGAKYKDYFDFEQEAP